MVILDSDLIIKVMRGKNRRAIEVYDYLIEHEILLKTTIFTYGVLIEGAYLYHNVAKSLCKQARRIRVKMKFR